MSFSDAYCRVLTCFFPQYHIGSQLLAFVVIAPYMSIHKWRHDLEPPILHKPVNSTWYYSHFLLDGFPSYPMILRFMFKVFPLPSCICLYQHGDVSGRSVHGTLPKSLSFDCVYGLSNTCR